MTLTQGDPAEALKSAGRMLPKVYLVASDMSDESLYAIQWAIGTVLRQGDELLVVSVMETDSKRAPNLLSAQTRKLTLHCSGLGQAIARAAQGKAWEPEGSSSTRLRARSAGNVAAGANEAPCQDSLPGHPRQKRSPHGRRHGAWRASSRWRLGTDPKCRLTTESPTWSSLAREV